MVKTTMVEADIPDGERVVSALEQSGIKVIAAFWSPSAHYERSDEQDDWHLIVVSPDVAPKGGPSAYERAFAVLKDFDVGSPRWPDFWWDRIKILSPSTLIYRELKRRAGTGDRPFYPGWAYDSYIYKLE